MTTTKRTVEVALTRVTAVVSKHPVKATVRKKPEGVGAKTKQVQREGVMDPGNGGGFGEQPAPERGQDDRRRSS